MNEKGEKLMRWWDEYGINPENKAKSDASAIWGHFFIRLHHDKLSREDEEVVLKYAKAKTGEDSVTYRPSYSFLLQADLF